MNKLDTLLQKVRDIQHFLAIIAEILILLAFAMSGMDTSISGAMAGIPWLKWFWAGVFALGIDTSFVIAWVRCRQCVVDRKAWYLLWNLPVALGMSVIVFQPVVIQLLQQSLDIGFNQALSMLGINIVILVYLRAIVAVFLGAILALTNVESKPPIERQSAQPGRLSVLKNALLDRAIERVTPVAQPAQVPAQVESTEQPKQIEQATVKQSAKLHVVKVTQETSPLERVKKVLSEHPNAGYNELGRLTGLAPATAQKYRKLSAQNEQIAATGGD